MPPLVIGIRHGEVENPRNVIYSGLPGYHLSDLGRQQARSVADALRDAGVAALYASPLERAVETASFISEATGTPIVEDERLVEWMHWQQWAGMTWEQMADHPDGSFERYTTDPGSVTAGESLDELADRFESWLADVRRDHPEGLVVGVTHLEPLRAILLRKLGRPWGDLFQLRISQCEVVRLEPDASTDPIPIDRLGALAGRGM